MSPIEVVSGASPEQIDAAARIWAEATAARDRDPDVAPLGLARTVIANVVEGQPRAILLMALGPDRQPLGFAAVEGSSDSWAELRYLGVSPSAWGQGTGACLLAELAHRLRSHGLDGAELWVYEDNYAAIALYRRLGWQADGLTRTHPRSGRTEAHYALDLRCT